MPELSAPAELRAASFAASAIRARTFILALSLAQITALGSRAIYVAFRGEGRALAIGGDGHALLRDEKLAVCGYFTLVLAGVVALVWYALQKAISRRRHESNAAVAVLALVLAVISVISPGSWLVPHLLAAGLTFVAWLWSKKRFGPPVKN
ncbi:MAG: hypothetical protein V3W41_11685 [Planctomycetota bacterium]